MIIAFIGTVGSGKTLGAVYEAYKYHRYGYTVYSNIHLAFPHVKITQAVFQKLMEGEELNNAIILIDEAHIWIDSRSSMTKKNKIISYFILQTRKRNVRLLVTTQHMHQIEKRLRDTVDIIILCENLTSKNSLVNKGPVLILQKLMYQWDDTRPIKLRTLKGTQRLFGLYDTTEIVQFTEAET